MFSYRVYCDDPKIRSVIVCHGELKEEQSYPCTDGAAYIQLYTPDARILFEDEKRRRYATTVDYNLQKLMDEESYLEPCVTLDVTTPGFLLAVCQNDGKKPITLETLGCYQHIVQMPEFQESYRHTICRKILKYYAAHAGDDTLDTYLKKMDLMTFASVDKVLLCEILIQKGMYAMALEIISQEYNSDKLSCLPLQFTITNVFYNKDAFEAAGIECPTVDDRWTMDEVYEAAKKLQDSGAVKYGMAMDYSRARYDNLMYMNGGSLVEKDGDSFKVVADSQQNVDTLQAFVDANNSGIMPKAIWAGGSSDNPGDYFKNGDVGIYFSGSWNYNPFVQDITSFKFGVMPSPVGSAGGSAILGGAGLAVPTNAKNKDLALEFLKWFYTDKNFADYLALDKGLSSLKSVTYEPADPDQAADYKVLQAEVGQTTDAFAIDESSEWRNYYDNEYRDALKQSVNGDLTPSDALTEFATALADKAGWAH